ncbi:MAG: hypothetical protein KDI31_08750 [Pseudomonadales bacterium]|nr:hypothetical protein [Pseudomonadales bacterium]
MSNEKHRNDPPSRSDRGIETDLKEYFHNRREQTAIPDFDRMLQRVDAEFRSRADPGVQPVAFTAGHHPGDGHWRRWFRVPGVLVGVGVLCLVILAGLFVTPEVTAPEADAVLLAQLEQTTLWVAPSDRWLKPASSPILMGIPDFSAMQFHLTETLTWSDLEG